MSYIPEPDLSKMAAYLEKTVEAMGRSSVVCTLFTNNYKESVQAWLEFSASVMLDKPIFLLVPEDVVIPKKVQLIADRIVRYGPNKSLEDATKELQAFVAGLPE